MVGIFGALNIGASGLKANATAQAATSNNVANATTDGFKSTRILFESLVTRAGGPGGGVVAKPRLEAGNQAIVYQTGTGTDLAIVGDGFLPVRGPDGETLLTRAGGFRRAEDGTLTNAAGLTLLGVPAGQTLPADLSGLVPVRVPDSLGAPEATGQVSVDANLPADLTATTPIADLAQASGTRLTVPADGAITLPFTDAQGGNRTATLDVLRVDSTSTPNLYALRLRPDSVAGLDAGADARFVAATGPNGGDLSSDNLLYARFNGDGSLENLYVEGAFGPAARQITVDPGGVVLSPVQAAGPDGGPAVAVAVGQPGVDYALNTAGNPVDAGNPFAFGSGAPLAVADPARSPFGTNGPSAAIFGLDLGTPTGLFGNDDPATALGGGGLDGLTQFASPGGPPPAVSVNAVNADGAPASPVTGVQIGGNGSVDAVLADGSTRPLFTVPTVTVSDPTALAEVSGTAFRPTAAAGTPQLNQPGQGGAGSLVAGALEGSDVNLDDQMVQMIVNRAAFQANVATVTTTTVMGEALLDMKS